METTKIIQEVELRLATKEDFPASNGRPVFNSQPYYCLQSTGVSFDKKLYLFNENTDLNTFKELYANQQIYVPVYSS